jgi:hypothetical protein
MIGNYHDKQSATIDVTHSVDGARPRALRTPYHHHTLQDVAASGDGELELWIVSLRHPVTQQAKQELDAVLAPQRVEHYLPHSSYVVHASAAKARQVLHLDGVLSVFEYHESYRIEPELKAFT